MSSEVDHLLWLDLETTGTDESKDSIIEIGCILTTVDLEPVLRYRAIVRPTDEALGRLLRNPVVRDMHEANGLLAEITADSDDVLRPHEAAKQLLELLDGYGKIALAGSGVAHFDRRFLARWMPQLDKRLTYWSLDVGVLRRAYRLWTGADLSAANDGKTHRADVDAECHLAEAREFRVRFSVKGDES